MSDVNKLVAAILAAGRCQTLNGAEISEYVHTYRLAMAELNKPEEEEKKAEQARLDVAYDEIGKGIPDA